jgi:hypothetical protein
MEIAARYSGDFAKILPVGYINMVYIGRGGTDMYPAITPLFSALKTCLDAFPQLFNKFRLHFIGTSYAPPGTGKNTILPLAEQYDLAEYVHETTDRLSFYHTLATLQQADALFIPGSDDPAYSASKLFPYIWSGKPMLTIFHRDSPAQDLLLEFGAPNACAFQTVEPQTITAFLIDLANSTIPRPFYRTAALKKYSADYLTHEQCAVFDEVIASS